MIAEHPFWTLLILACIGWYACITVYVGVRGWLDIRHMFRKLREIPDASRKETGDD